MSGVAPDGSPVAVYRRLPPLGEPEVIHAAVPEGALLELGCGAGRITHALIGLGHHVVGVDASAEMLGHVEGAETVVADIEGLVLGRTFAGVILGSHLVNVPDVALRRAFLATCRRHIAPGGAVVIERHDPAAWSAGSEPRRSTINGVGVAVRDLKRDGRLASAVVEYEVDGHRWEQPFTAELLDDDEVSAALAEVGLAIRAIPAPKWVVAEIAS